ncbi:hypothetical protein K431DRAFT_301428 [Polychaeton citri CBS 116435]|uniref:Nudix hydrolase domain-containing protein n=1 Tax=Polychaeton citri CBS 116435 TaxID=1314669 RepID=A0A9P4QCK3_9PEZI|nr:hypothetical protein K431DRAFT_301428 [Polychaeton citri CBS 116435]
MDRSFNTSQHFTLSAGTCTLDVNRRKCLVVHCRKTGEFFLPKGRKDVSESLRSCALRETLEETGHHAYPLPLDVPTNATVGEVREAHLADGNCEPVAVTQRTIHNADGRQTRKIIFWYASQGDSTAEAVSNMKQEGEEDYEGVWVDCNDVSSTLTWDDDKGVADYVMNLAFNRSANATHGQ